MNKDNIENWEEELKYELNQFSPAIIYDIQPKILKTLKSFIKSLLHQDRIQREEGFIKALNSGKAMYEIGREDMKKELFNEVKNKSGYDFHGREDTLGELISREEILSLITSLNK